MFQVCPSDPCLIRLSTGYVEGFEKTTVLNDKNYVAFTGIPYAEPPIGQLRFKVSVGTAVLHRYSNME